MVVAVFQSLYLNCYFWRQTYLLPVVGGLSGSLEVAKGILFCFHINLVPRIVSEPLFQSSYQMTTLAQGIVFVGVFETADIRFRMSNTLLFIAISPFRFLTG